MRVSSVLNLLCLGSGFLPLLVKVVGAQDDSSLTLEMLQGIVTQIKGPDNRLFRWDAGEVTAQHQTNGACNHLRDVAQLLIDKEGDDDDWLIAAADFCTLCIANNPGHRATFSLVPDIHKTVVQKLVPSANPTVSALGAHLIYIATYTNERSHQYFFQQGAVPALAKVIKNDMSMPLAKMWSAIALGNMAASYCETKQDGTCYWEWTAESNDIQLAESSSKVFSDGTNVRKAMLQEEGLVEALTELACHPPIFQDPESEEETIMAGYTARAKEHDNEPTMVTWAAMGALKNLALEPTAKPFLTKATVCACYLKESSDWLEESKSYGLLGFVRRTEDPCWFREEGLCIDDHFMDQGFYSCLDYEGASDQECQEGKDVFTGVLAEEACCECGGGHESPARRTTGDEL